MTLVSKAAWYPGNVYGFDVAAGRGGSSWIRRPRHGGRPHADTHELVLDPAAAAGTDAANAGGLFDLNDGGVFKLDLQSRTWSSLNGGDTNGAGALRISEITSLAYDQLAGLLFAGAQDNGDFEQVGAARTASTTRILPTLAPTISPNG